MSHIVEFNRVTFAYPEAAENEGFQLKDVSFSLKPGSFNVIVGRSGCGKSTVLQLGAGLIEPTSGEIVRPENKSMVFQDGALLPWRTAGQNIELAFDGLKRKPGKTEQQKIIEEELAKMKILARKDSLPRQLSGGEKQRVGIARALVVKPDLLLLDEPFSALDVLNTKALHAELLSIWKHTGMTILMVSHSVGEAVELADKILVMEHGRIKEEVELGMERPRHEESPNFLGIMTRLKRMI